MLNDTLGRSTSETKDKEAELNMVNKKMEEEKEV
jgi:hypothetical protein